MEKLAMSGDASRSASSMMRTCSLDMSLALLAAHPDGTGNRALRHVASLARQAWDGAHVEEAETDEMDELRDERDRSETMDSGLEPDDEADTSDGRRLVMYRSNPMPAPGYWSVVDRQRAKLCAWPMAKDMLERRDSEPYTLAAGVLEAIEVGVIWGVGNGPMRDRAGVGGRTLGVGSRKRGSTVAGVGVVSGEGQVMRGDVDTVLEVGSVRARMGILVGAKLVSPTLRLEISSRSGVSRGTILLHASLLSETDELCPGGGGS